MHQHYDVALVILSFVVSVFGSFTALQLALNIPLASTSSKRTMEVIVSGSVMGGAAIWAMHFIAMIACNMGVPVHYDIPLTIVSALLAMVACSVGLAVVAANGSRPANLLLAGTLMGVGVAGMHYLGMAAIVANVEMSFNVTLVVLSFVIAIAASMAALWLAFNLRGTAQMAGSAVVMGVAVCGMHYTGMAAVMMTAARNAVDMTQAGGISGGSLALVIFAVVCVTLIAALGVNLKRRQQRAELTI